jgi:hypothetical protein
MNSLHLRSHRLGFQKIQAHQYPSCFRGLLLLECSFQCCLLVTNESPDAIEFSRIPREAFHSVRIPYLKRTSHVMPTHNDLMDFRSVQWSDMANQMWRVSRPVLDCNSGVKDLYHSKYIGVTYQFRLKIRPGWMCGKSLPGDHRFDVGYQFLGRCRNRLKSVLTSIFSFIVAWCWWHQDSYSDQQRPARCRTPSRPHRFPKLVGQTRQTTEFRGNQMLHMYRGALRLLREPLCLYVQREYFESFRIFITVSLC